MKNVAVNHDNGRYIELSEGRIVYLANAVTSEGKQGFSLYTKNSYGETKGMFFSKEGFEALKELILNSEAGVKGPPIQVKKLESYKVFWKPCTL